MPCILVLTEERTGREPRHPSEKNIGDSRAAGAVRCARDSEEPAE